MRTLGKARCPALLTGLLGAATCAGSAEEAPRSPFDDPDLARWVLAAAPSVAIGGADEREDYALDRVTGAVLLPGRLAVADAGFTELRFYSLSGEFLVRSGRQGAGPGEYGAMGGLAAVDDHTVAVWDVRYGRFNLVGTDGDVRGTVAADLSVAERIMPRFVGVLADGRYVFRDSRPVMMMRGEPDGERRDPVRYLVLEPDGAWQGVQWEEPGEEEYYSNYNGSRGTTPVIFGGRPSRRWRAGT